MQKIRGSAAPRGAARNRQLRFRTAACPAADERNVSGLRFHCATLADFATGNKQETRVASRDPDGPGRLIVGADGPKDIRHDRRPWYKNAVSIVFSVGTYMDADGDASADFRDCCAAGLPAWPRVTAIWLMPFQPSPGRTTATTSRNMALPFDHLGDFVITPARQQRGLLVT